MIDLPPAHFLTSPLQHTHARTHIYTHVSSHSLSPFLSFSLSLSLPLRARAHADNWQACGSKEAAPGMHYHRADGSPIVNLALFPDFNKMTAHAHSLNLTSGWYGNNCICSDHAKGDATEAQIKMDVAALIKCVAVAHHAQRPCRRALERALERQRLTRAHPWKHGVAPPCPPPS